MADSPASGRFSLRNEVGLEFEYLLGHVQDPLQEIDALAFDVDLILCPYRPESLFQVVVLRGTEAMHIAVCTVVVGDEKTLVGDDASGTCEFKGNDSIGYR